MSEEKIQAREDLARTVEELRRDAARTPKFVFTNGCFDLVHVGHLRYLWETRKQGDRLIVAINDDDSVRRLKGEDRPILKLIDRARVMAGFACVDFVTWFHEDTPLALLEELRPEFLVKGADYSIDQVVGRELVESWGGEVKTLGLVEGCSTTNLIEKVLSLQSTSAG